MAKRKTSKKKQNKKPFKYLYYINLSIAIMLTILLSIFAYNLYVPNDTKNINTPKISKQENIKLTQKTNHERFEEKTKALEIEYIDNDIKKPETKITKQTVDFNFEKPKQTIKTPNKTINKQEEIITPIKIDTRPILAILIDDVTLSTQIKKIKDIGYPITMAFFPPTSIHKNSAKIAQAFTKYMIHLPLEAGTKRFE